MRALDPLPVTRFDLDKAKESAEAMGYRLVESMPERFPFKSPEECWLWYDRLPYLGEDRATERRLMAAITLEAIPKGRMPEVDGDLAQADILAAAGRPLDAMNEISKVYNSCVKIIDGK